MKNINKIYAATLVSMIGNFSSKVLLSVLVYSKTQDKSSLVLSFLVMVLPSVLLGNQLGHLIEKYNPKRLFIVTDLLGFVLFTALGLFYHLMDAKYVGGLFFVSFVLVFIFDATKAKILSFESKQGNVLNQSLALIKSLSYLAIALGPLVGGYLIDIAGVSSLCFFNGLTFLVSIMFISSFTLSTGYPDGQRLKLKDFTMMLNFYGPLKRNIQDVMAHRTLKVIFLMFVIRSAGYGIVNSLAPVVALSSLNLGAKGIGSYYFWVCIGGFVSSMLYKKMASDQSAKTTSRWYFVGWSLLEGVLLFLCFRANSAYAFYLFGFLACVPMILIENRYDYIILHSAAVDAKAKMHAFQSFLKACVWSVSAVVASCLVESISRFTLSLLICLLVVLATAALINDKHISAT